MKIKFNIQRKIQLWLLSFTLIIFLAALLVVSLRLRNTVLKNSYLYIDEMSQKYANEVANQLNVDFGVARGIAYGYRSYQSIPLEERFQFFSDFQLKVLQFSDRYISVWSAHELQFFDKNWGNEPGRVNVSVSKFNGKYIFTTDSLDIGGVKRLTPYHTIKEKKREHIMEPYYDMLTLKDQNILETTIAIPILFGDNFGGIVGLDIELTSFAKLIAKIHNNEDIVTMLVAHNGAIVAHSDTQFVGKMVYDFDEGNNNLEEKIAAGKPFSFVTDNTNTNEFKYISFAPISLGETETPWFLVISVPKNQIISEANTSFLFAIFVIIIGIIFLFLLITLIAKRISVPILIITENLKQLAKGRLMQIENKVFNTHDEISEMQRAFNVSVEALMTKADFAKSIGNGNLENEVVLLGDDDVLGKSLQTMQQSLLKAYEEQEKAKLEQETRRWTNEGITLFSEILREYDQDIEELSFKLIQQLTHYVDLQIGGLYMLRSDTQNSYFELLATYAYDRRKFVERKIMLNEGVVGACAAEKKTIILKNIPETYLQISTGIGNAKPQFLVVSPLIFEEKVLGVVELAGLKEISQVKISFIEKVAESIASTLASAKINSETQILLEQFKNQQELMHAQEEELRQNLEELQATQEEMERRTTELEELNSALYSSSMLAEYDSEGNLVMATDEFYTFFGYSEKKPDGIHIYDEFKKYEYKKFSFSQLWEMLMLGEGVQLITPITLFRNKFIIINNLIPLSNKKGEVYKIIKLTMDITANIKFLQRDANNQNIIN